MWDQCYIRLDESPYTRDIIDVESTNALTLIPLVCSSIVNRYGGLTSLYSPFFWLSCLSFKLDMHIHVRIHLTPKIATMPLQYPKLPPTTLFTLI